MSQKRFRTIGEKRIGELARWAGINPRTLRYYERIGLLAPSGRTDAGYRLYTEQDARRLAFIRRAQALGLSLAEISRVLRVDADVVRGWLLAESLDDGETA